MRPDALKFLFFILLIFLESLPNFGYCQVLIPPQSNNQHLKAAEALVEKDNVDSAMVHLNALLHSNHWHRQALVLRSKILHNKRLYERAIVDYTALLELNSDDKEIRYLRGLARQNVSLYKLAIEDYLYALGLTNDETNVAFFRMDQNTNSAVGISTISSMDSDIYNNIGLCFHELQDYKQALMYFNQAIESIEFANNVLVNRAITYEALGETALAIKDYSTVLENDPDHSIASFNLLKLTQNEGTNDEALNALIQFVKENPELASGYEALGFHYFQKQDYELALINFQFALESDSSNIDYKFNLALAMEKNRRYSEAKILFEDVAEIDPHHSGAYFNLANIHFKSADFYEAISYYSLAHFYNPANHFILYNRALAYYETNQIDAACSDMLEVLKTNESLASEFCEKFCGNISK